MRTKIDAEMIRRINESYARLKVKSRVAKELGIAPSTVTKYLSDEFKPKSLIQTVPFSTNISDPLLNGFKGTDFSVFCRLSPEEEAGIEELKKEVVL